MEYLAPEDQAADLAVRQVAHDLGFTPPPVPASPTLAENKSQVTPFDFNGNDVRAIVDDKGNPWFVAKDVCDILGYENSSRTVQDHCKSPKLLKGTESVALKIPNRGMLIVNEPDLYRLITRSTLPAAERFEAWVMEVVLPAIRNYGGYLTPQATEQALNDPDFIIGLATKLKEERAKSAELAVANARIEAEKVRIVEEKIALEVKKQELTHDNAVLKPKAKLHDVLMDADGSITINEAAKILNEEFPALGANGLFSFLRRKGVLMYNLKKNNVPTQAYMNKGYFRVAQKTSVHNETVYSYSQTYVKPLGMKFIYHLLENSYRYRGRNRAA